jgi:hypothetical protein
VSARAPMLARGAGGLGRRDFGGAGRRGSDAEGRRSTRSARARLGAGRTQAVVRSRAPVAVLNAGQRMFDCPFLQKIE